MCVLKKDYKGLKKKTDTINKQIKIAIPKQKIKKSSPKLEKIKSIIFYFVLKSLP